MNCKICNHEIKPGEFYLGTTAPNIQHIKCTEAKENKPKEATRQSLFEELHRLKSYAKAASLVSVKLFESAHSVELIERKLEDTVLQKMVVSSDGR